MYIDNSNVIRAIIVFVDSVSPLNSIILLFGGVLPRREAKETSKCNKVLAYRVYAMRTNAIKRDNYRQLGMCAATEFGSVARKHSVVAASCSAPRMTTEKSFEF